MDLSLHRAGEVQIIRLNGPMKLGESVDSFRQTGEELLSQGEVRVVVNLSAVPMVDSSGIGALVRLMTSAKQRGGNLKLVAPSKLTLQTLRIVGLAPLFEIYEDELQAISSFAG